MIHTSTLPDVVIPGDVSITDFTLRKVDELADQPAIIDGPSVVSDAYREMVRLLPFLRQRATLTERELTGEAAPVRDPERFLEFMPWLIERQDPLV